MVVIIQRDTHEAGMTDGAGRFPDAPIVRSDDRFEEIYHLHYRRLLGYVTRLCGEPDLAADIVQESFVRLHAQGRTLESPGPWLLTVATNLLRNARSRGARRAELAAQTLPNEPHAVSDPAERREEQERVRRVLGTLPPRDQELLALLAGGYRYREMAQALGIHEASVGTLLARAKHAFRTAYGRLGGTS
jgi:RNA polymerase sigma factor (sigma-70 family)